MQNYFFNKVVNNEMIVNYFGNSFCFKFMRNDFKYYVYCFIRILIVFMVGVNEEYVQVWYIYFIIIQVVFYVNKINIFFYQFIIEYIYV